ncbi:glycine betaine/L-proline ABC transporter substrate-binding protein ProX [Oceanimonas sp. NS1]|nr:glycine betaine/L-proline ABC transporter substrate-binding protein ProX [Oceanimonas sp. NS1]
MQSAIKQLSRKTLTAGALLTLSFGGAARAESQPGKGVSVTPIFPSIAEERFRGEIAIAGLEALGYEVVKPKETEYPAMMLALSYGDADFSVHPWEVLHDSFYQKAGGDDTMVQAGSIIPGVLQGYLIDKKTADAYNIRSLADLKNPDIAKLFDANGDGKADLTGCNPGWGCELVINHHMEAYGLEEYVNNNQGSYFALMADTIARYQAGQPILYFTWVPQWIAGVLVEGKDVEWLEVPFTSLPGGEEGVNTMHEGKNLGFAIDRVMAVMNKDFAEDNPVAQAFLSRVQISAADESAQNLKMQDGEKSIEDIKRHAREWIAANRSTFDGWLEHARAVAN